MLKFTVNKNNLKEYEEKISVEEILYDGELINIKTTHPHGFRSGDFINFKRTNVDSKEVFRERVFIDVIDKTTFTVEKFEDLVLSVRSCEKVDIYSPLTKGYLKAIKIDLSEQSNIITNRLTVPNNAFPNEVNNSTKRRCKGDLVNFNNIYLLRASNVEGNKYVEYDETNYNTLETIYFKYRNTTISMDILVPLTYGGYDNQYTLYWFYEDDKNANIILTHYGEGVFFSKDVRFLKKEDGVVNFRKDFSGNTDSYIYFLKNVLDVDFSVNENFNTNLLKNDYYKDFYVENVINENINEIVDMEKQIFIPRLYDSETKKTIDGVLNEINIKLKVRERNEENGGWNSTLLEDSWYGDGKGDNGGDRMTSITDIGFDKDDIKYQKTSLKKSFIRLSFYDTPHRGNQKLLYYSTVFLDANKIFNDYFSKGKISDLEFVIKNSFDYSACSEGYYLYLFPKLAKKDIPTTIYMKVEFNHAKYGKTITFVLPSDDDYKDGYTNSETIGTKGIEKLFNDLYIKVNIMYDSNTNSYVWYIPDLEKNKINYNNNKTITMTLYEPIVYKIN